MFWASHRTAVIWLSHMIMLCHLLWRNYQEHLANCNVFLLEGKPIPPYTEVVYNSIVDFFGFLIKLVRLSWNWGQRKVLKMKAIYTKVSPHSRSPAEQLVMATLVELVIASLRISLLNSETTSAEKRMADLQTRYQKHNEAVAVHITTFAGYVRQSSLLSAALNAYATNLAAETSQFVPRIEQSLHMVSTSTNHSIAR